MATETEIEISLFCWILGLDDGNIFPVDILTTRTVGHLKRAIKEENKNALNYIDAQLLEIWKVNYPAQCSRHY